MSRPFDPSLPLARAHTLPTVAYTDPAIDRAERSAIFRRTWQLAGRTESLREIGSFITSDVAGEPILLVRGEDGRLRGFWNVCWHRAAPLLTDDCGTCTKLRCRYHGWTYDLAGELRGTPEWAGVEDFERSEYGLKPVPGLAEFGPFAFVKLDAPEPGFEAAYPEFAAWSEGREAIHLPMWFERRSYELNCNWKVYVDNFLDGGYHVNTVHPALAGAIDYREYRTDVFPLCSLQSSPLKATDGVVGATRTGEAAYWWLWPNAMINAYSGAMDTNVVWPLGPDRCRVVFDFFFAPDSTESFRRDSIAVAEEVQREDIDICEQVQRGLQSTGYDTGRFSVLREAGGHAFHRFVAAALDPSTGGIR